jgi:hypothetical protein
MALVLADRVRETTTTTGTGSVTLAGAYTGFQTFSAAIGNTNSTYYTIANVSSGEWEVGIGTYSSGGNLLSRTTVLSSSNGGSLVNFGAGAKDVFVTQPAERALYIASAGTGLESQVTAFTNGGIVYASSTSALTTGSALTYDGTGLVTINGGSSANGTLRLIRTGSFPGDFSILAGGQSATTNFLLYDNTNSQNAYLYLGGASGYHAWYQNGTEALRLTSTSLYTASTINVGIGTSTPTAKLEVRDTNPTILLSNSSSRYGYMQWENSGSELRVGTDGVFGIRFDTNASRRMTLDSSGNLGLGVTPSAWGTTSKAMQFSTGAFEARSASFSSNTNAYFNSGWLYVGTGRATLYNQTDGQHVWYNSASGTAGNAITFTQAMTLDAGGRLLLNRTTNNNNEILQISGNANALCSAFFANTTTGQSYGSYIAAGTNSTDYALRIQNAAANTDYLKVTGDGNLGIGETSPTAKLQISVASAAVNGTKGVRITNPAGTIVMLECGSGGDSFIGTTSGSDFNIRTGNTVRATFDNAGNLLVGTTSVIGASDTGTTHIAGGGASTNQPSLYLRNPASTAGRYWKVGPTNDAGYIIYNDSNTGQYMSYGGTTWNSSSDERVKTNLIPIENAAAKVLTLRAVTGRYISDDEGTSRSFLIAQDVQAVLPEAVDVQGDEQGTLGLAYTAVIPLLVAAIKEQSALITQLTARITALEGA